MWEPSRDFAYAKLPSGHTKGIQSICALSNVSPQLMLVTAEGFFYQFSIDLQNGGECQLLKQYSLLDGEEEGTSGGR